MEKWLPVVRRREGKKKLWQYSRKPLESGCIYYFVLLMHTHVKTYQTVYFKYM